MFGTSDLLKLKRSLKELDSITGTIEKNWGDLKRYEDSFFEWLQNEQYMGGFYDYLRGDYDKILLSDVNSLVVKLETFFREGKNYADIETWELKDDVKGEIRLSYHELADYLGLWRTIIHKYTGTGGKTHQKPLEESLAKVFSDEAIRALSKAVNKELLVIENGKYKLNKMSKTQLAYLIGRLCCGDSLLHDSYYGDRWKLGTISFPEKSDLEPIFIDDVKNLCTIRTNNVTGAGANRERPLPRGYEVIEELLR